MKAFDVPVTKYSLVTGPKQIKVFLKICSTREVSLPNPPPPPQEKKKRNFSASRPFWGRGEKNMQIARLIDVLMRIDSGPQCFHVLNTSAWPSNLHSPWTSWRRREAWKFTVNLESSARSPVLVIYTASVLSFAGAYTRSSAPSTLLSFFKSLFYLIQRGEALLPCIHLKKKKNSCIGT